MGLRKISTRNRRGGLENFEPLNFDEFNIDWGIQQISDETTLLEQEEVDLNRTGKETIICPNCGIEINIYGDNKK